MLGCPVLMFVKAGFVHQLIAQADGSVRDSVDSIAATNDQIMLALIAVIATSIGALVWVIRNGRYAKASAEQAAAANSAVNNVGPGKHNLYDMVSNIHDDVIELKDAHRDFTKRGWHALEPPIDTAIGLTRTISEMQHDHDELHHKLDTVLEELRAHVEWEQTTKYPPHNDNT